MRDQDQMRRGVFWEALICRQAALVRVEHQKIQNMRHRSQSAGNQTQPTPFRGEGGGGYTWTHESVLPGYRTPGSSDSAPLNQPVRVWFFALEETFEPYDSGHLYKLKDVYVSEP